MSNTAINYTAKRALQSGVTVGDLVVINVTLTQFNQRPEVSKTEETSKSGIKQASLDYITDVYQCVVVDDGEVTTADMEQFLRSVAAREAFSITSLDDNDAVLSVTLEGAWSRTRRSAAFIDSFQYSFNVRVIV